MTAFDDACEYAASLGIPDEFIEDVVAESALCCDGPYGDGDCCYDTKRFIEQAAERYERQIHPVFGPRPDAMFAR